MATKCPNCGKSYEEITYGSTRIGEKWDYPDAVYKKKEIRGSYLLEFIAGTERGGHIRIWHKIGKDDMAEFEGNCERKPLTWESADHGWYHEGDASFMYYENAKHRYDSIKTKSDVMNLLHDMM